MGSKKANNSNDDDNEDEQQQQIRDAICSILKQQQKGSNDYTVKNLRKEVFLTLQLDEDDDKAAKKLFKKATQSLESDGTLQLDADGTIQMTSSSKNKEKEEKKKKKKDKKEKKEKRKSKDKGDDDNEEKEKRDKKKRKTNDDVDNDDNRNSDSDDPFEEDNQQEDGCKKDHSSENEADKNDNKNYNINKDKNKPCQGNPQGVTRLFLGNLPFAVDEASLEEFMKPTGGTVTHIKWITDKETGQFYGSAFIEMEHSVAAMKAVTEMNGQSLMGRPMKINFAPSRPGDIWPPAKKVIAGNVGASGEKPKGGGTTTGGQAGGQGIKAMSAKPENCHKLFIGNLSYDIDDEAISKFFMNVDAEIKAVRWLHHKDTGDFKGVGFVEFWNTEACEKAATLNGKSLLGRPIRIDWTT